MTLSEMIKKNATSANLFPQLSSSEKKYNYIAAEIAVKIRNKRKELKLTQKQFAKLLNVSQGMVSKWESAEYNFTVEKLVELYDKLDIYFILKEKTAQQTITAYKRFENLWSNPALSKKSKNGTSLRELEKSA